MSQMSIEAVSREAAHATAFWTELKAFNNKHMPRRPCRNSVDEQDIPTWQNRNIKIALIDTGVNLCDSVVARERERFSGKSCVDEDENQYHDTCGHGTHLARLVLKVTDVADIIVGKVSRDKTFTKRNVLNIAEVRFYPLIRNETHTDIGYYLGCRTKRRYYLTISRFQVHDP
jgi:hypothetical protein